MNAYQDVLAQSLSPRRVICFEVMIRLIMNRTEHPNVDSVAKMPMIVIGGTCASAKAMTSTLYDELKRRKINVTHAVVPEPAADDNFTLKDFVKLGTISPSIVFSPVARSFTELAFERNSPLVEVFVLDGASAHSDGALKSAVVEYVDSLCPPSMS